MTTTGRPVIVETDCPGLTLIARGKVRDVYEVDERSLLFVATDRISAFDVVMAGGIPGKGRILTQLSLFWFQLLGDCCPNHLISADVARMPEHVQRHGEQIEGRSLWVERLAILPVEAIVRGYLAGTSWKEYQAHGTICGIRLPKGLLQSSILPEPLYTPSTKAAPGAHDLNIHPDQAATLLGAALAKDVAAVSVRLYRRASEHARSRGIIIADTKFEFGTDAKGRLVLADEVLTPDSSRFWPVDGYRPGASQDSFDKQYLRDYLERIGFDKDGPGISLPADVAQGTAERYCEAFRRLTGRDPQL